MRTSMHFHHLSFPRGVAVSGLLVASAGCPATPGDGGGTTEAAQTEATTADLPTLADDTPGSTAESTTTDSETGASETGDSTADPTASTTTTEDPSTGPDTGTTTSVAVCGDGQVDAPEACDDGPQNGSYGACAADCGGPGEFCGDGVVNGPEACDDGNADDTDACVSGCVAAVCGDGLVQAGVEACDDMNADVEDACLPTCQPSDCNGCTFPRPNVLFVLDYSTSNNVVWTDQTRWVGVVTQLGDFLAQETALIQRVNLALLRFGHDPNTNVPGPMIACDSSGLVDGNKLDHAWTVNGEYLICEAANFAATLASIPSPCDGKVAGIGTWTQGALLRATTLITDQRALFMEDPAMAPYYRIVLITDGEWTDSTGTMKLAPAPQNPALAATDLLANHNVKTHVIGIGEAVNKPFADELAAAGGTVAAIDATQESFTQALQQVFAAIDADGIIPADCSQ